MALSPRASPSWASCRGARKDLVGFDTDHHLLFNECLPQVLPRVVELIAGLDAQQPALLRTAFPGG